MLGERLPVVKLHPKIKGVDGTASAEVPLVSFNQDALSLWKGAGLQCSDLGRGGVPLWRSAERAADTRRPQSAAHRRCYRHVLGRCLGAGRGIAEAAARAAEDVFAAMFDPKPAAEGTTDEAQAARLRESMRKVARGEPLSILAPDLREGVRFHVLALAPNAARLAVRTWLSNDFSRFALAMARHQEDLAMEPPPWKARWPSCSGPLLRTTAVQEKPENVPAGLAGAVLEAVLPRRPIRARCLRRPSSVCARVTTRRAAGSRGHQSLLSRTRSEEPVPVSLDPDDPSPAYQLGRLFALMEAAQRTALGRVNSSIADRYYGAASATPARVFGALMRREKPHLRRAQTGRGFWIEERMQQIIDKLPSALPTTLRLEDQGRFAIGYYHERAYRPERGDDGAPSAQAAVEVV